MKILQINTWYGTGSTGKIVKSLHEGYLNHGFDSYVIYGRGVGDVNANKNRIIKGSYTLESKFNSVLSRFTGIMYGGCLFSTLRIIRLIKRINPDIVHIHCVNAFMVNNYKLFKFLGKGNYKIIYTLHAEYPYTGACSHSFDCKQWLEGCKKCPRLKQANRSLLLDRTKKSWLKMKEAIDTISPDNMVVVSVSEWLDNNSAQSAILRRFKHSVIHNGVDISIFSYRSLNNKFACLKDNDRYLCLYLTPNFSSDSTDIKGGDYFLSLSKMFVEHPDVLFIVAGGNSRHFDFSQYKNIKYLNNVSDSSDLAMLYSICDVTLMLSRRETFSLVTAESLSCGTPVIGFKSGGPESISTGENVVFFEQGDLDSLKAAILKKQVNKTTGTTLFDQSTMIELYTKVIDELIGKQRK